MDVECCVIVVAHRIIMWLLICLFQIWYAGALIFLLFQRSSYTGRVYLHRNYETPNLYNSGANWNFAIALNLLLDEIF